MKSLRAVTVLQYTLLTLLAAVILYPVLYAFLTAFMTQSEAMSYPPALVPHQLYWDNFRAVLHFVPIARFMGNSLIIALSITLGHLLLGSLSAYAFANIRFAGKPFWFALFLSTMMIPWEVTMIPNYLTVRAWGWLDTYPAMIVPFLASAFSTFLLRQFFLQLPGELFEAARMDGCGHWRTYALIVLPLARPALATVAVYSFLNAWNTYMWPLLVTNSPKMRTVQIGVSMMQSEEFTSWSAVLAGVVIILLPSLLLLVLGLKQLVRGMTAGAVKG
ncbi:carbohydrate ABC transporter permease [Paenibacillus cremeus]|uniref:Carbohydrate ABC transporter permease n=1 Tax=Paenibacillus cremeus TaxID=2163881 RepID=A0A559K6S6_9BACL|nr:carbohydrate ABC transporter permease [Paenibacillus cremeus]TVY07830.1 carbohydrate ABC transporter permease [Paenibacillus cremeus]